MRPSLRVLSASLLAATMGMSVLGGRDEAVALSSQANEQAALIPVAANGGDTVGGLLPLPLWPPVRVHKEHCQRNHRGRLACTDRAASSMKR